MFRLKQVRCYSELRQINFFKLFPKSYPNGGPPKDPFKTDLRKLRKEYLKLLTDSHPDKLVGSAVLKGDAPSGVDEASKVLNKAYGTLKSPLTRSQHVLQLNGVDVVSDDPNGLGAEIRNSFSGNKELLLMILDIHERLEDCSNKEELKGLKEENDARIAESESRLEELFREQNWDEAAVETIRLNFWFNIKNAIKEWEPGKPVNLTH